MIVSFRLLAVWNIDFDMSKFEPDIFVNKKFTKIAQGNSELQETCFGICLYYLVLAPCIAVSTIFKLIFRQI